jgi:hypothetical protein
VTMSVSCTQNLQRANKLAVSQSECTLVFLLLSLLSGHLLDMMHIDSLLANVLTYGFIIVAGNRRQQQSK